MSTFEQTLERAVSVSGVGLHSGLPSRVTIRPADPGSGIVFFRTDLDPDVPLKACIENVELVEGWGRQTTLRVGNCRVRTIEHLMAVFHGLGVDNARVEVEGEEIPGLDGSAAPYADLVRQAGLITQAKERGVFLVEEPVFLEAGGRSLAVFPADGTSISYTLSYDDKSVRDQFFHLDLSPSVFASAVAPSRTFCLKQEAELLLKQGYGRGASLENTLVFDDGRPVGNVLRFPDEAARHKILDLIGDFYLLGRPLRGGVVACRTGHRQNYEVIKKLLQKKSSIPRGKGDTVAMSTENCELGIAEIQKILPHRYPFLLVDKVVDFVPGKSATGIKQVTMNEHFFQGHFPGNPIMPGVLIVEAMAQVGGVIMLSMPQYRGKYAYFMSIDRAKFRQAVRPGDTLRIEVEVLRVRSTTGQCAAKAYVGQKVVCEGEVKFAVVGVDQAQME